MDRCAEYQAQMLEYVYDLLDEDVAQALALHLERCPVCLEARDAARDQQSLLATAARMEFPSISFQPPRQHKPEAPAPAHKPEAPAPAHKPEAPARERKPEAPVPAHKPEAPARGTHKPEAPARGPRPGETPVSPEVDGEITESPRPVLLPLASARPAKRRAWRAWASVAAALLLVSLPGWLGFDYLSARRAIDQAESNRNALRVDLDGVNQQVAVLDQQHREKARNLEQEVLQKELNIVVSGPRTIESGTPSRYRIQTRNGLGNEVSTRILSARVVDQEGKSLYEIKDAKSNGTYALDLPSLPVGPRSQVRLEVVAEGRDGLESKLSEQFELTAPLYRAHLATDRPVYQPGETVRFRALALERFSLEPAREKLDLRFTLSTPAGSLEVPSGALARRAGNTLTGWDAYPGDDPTRRGIAGGEWTIPESSPEGDYALTLSESDDRFAAQTRRFVVRHQSTPRLVKDLAFARPSYGPGEEVVAVCRALRADGGPLARRPVTVAATVNGQALAGMPLRLTTNDQGTAVIRFRLPGKSQTREPDRLAQSRVTQTPGGFGRRLQEPGFAGGSRAPGAGTHRERERWTEASLAVTFHDGSPETLVRPITITVDHLDVAFFPEGGRLVPGGPNRVYFRVRTPAGRPADLKARLIDDLGDEVARLETLNEDAEAGTTQARSASAGTTQARSASAGTTQARSASAGTTQARSANTRATYGTGVFRLTPYSGRTYHVEVESPAGVSVDATLDTREMGQVALTVRSAVTTAHEPIEAQVRSERKDRILWVATYCRGRLLDHRRVVVPASEERPVTLNPAHGAGGVYRITVFEEVARNSRTRLEPCAERLVFRRQRDRLNLSVKAGKDFYLPGERASLNISARGENQEQIPAVGLLSVVDRTSPGVADDHTARSVATHFYLTSEIRDGADLEHADFLLTSHPDAARALDLLMSTQGWRRFAPVPESGPAFALGVGPVLVDPAEVPRIERARGPASPKRKGEAQVQEAFSRVARLEQARKGLETNFHQERQRLDHRRAELAQSLQETRVHPLYLKAQARVEAYEGMAAGVRALFPLVGLFLVIALSVLLGRALGRSARESVPSLSAAGACAMLLVILGAVAFRGRPETDTGEPGAVANLSPEKKERLGEPAAAPANDPAREKEELREQGKATDRPYLKRKAGVVPREKAPPLPRADEEMKEARSKKDVAPVRQPALRPEQEGNASAKADKERFGYKRESYGTLPPSPVPPALGGGGLGGFAGKPTARQPGGEQGGFRPTLPTASDVDGTTLGRGVRVDPGKLLAHPSFDYRFEQGMDRAERKPGRRRSSARPGEDRGDREEVAFFIREYAHQRPANADPLRNPDLVDTVCWYPALVLPDGKAEVFFDLSDAATTYQVTVFGHTLDGRLAAATTTIEARNPLVVSATVPDEITVGDRLKVPVSVTNNTREGREVSLKLQQTEGWKTWSPAAGGPASEERSLRSDEQGGVAAHGADSKTAKPEGSSARKDLKVAAGTVSRRLIDIQPTTSGEAVLSVQAETAGLPPVEFRREVRVVPPGFSQSGVASGLIDGRVEQAVVLPRVLPGSLQFRVETFPSPQADLRKGLEGLARQAQIPPGYLSTDGSSLMVRDAFRAGATTRPGSERDRQDLLRLANLSANQPTTSSAGLPGGPAPVDEALAAYAALHLRYSPVELGDKAALERARRYLATHQKGQGAAGYGGKGGEGKEAFNRYANEYFRYANAYFFGLDGQPGKKMPETDGLKQLKEQALLTKDPALMALVGGAFAGDGRKAEMAQMLRKIALGQRPDGHVAAMASNLNTETTALAVLGWLRTDPVGFREPIRKGVRWLCSKRGTDGTFGSPRATVLALEALRAAAGQERRVQEAGELQLTVNGKKLARQPFTPQSSQPIVVPVPVTETALKEGRNVVRLEATGKNQLPYTLTWSYRSAVPSAVPGSPLKLSTSLNRQRLAEGQVVRLGVRLQNTSDRAQGSAVAVVGLPAGLSVASGQQEQLAKGQGKDAGKASIPGVEVRGRELILRWNGLAPRQVLEVPVDLVGRVPGEYQGPASRAYLTSEPGRITWVEPLRAVIEPKK
jgi:Alpha-2-macroglobulin family/MG2 domain